MSGDVIVTVTLNAGLLISYRAQDLTSEAVNPVSRPRYRATGRGIVAARVLHAFGHEVLTAGFAGGRSGDLIKADLAQSGVPTEFTQIRGESRQVFCFTEPAQRRLWFGEPGPYITTEELGRFAADYRRMLTGAAAVVLSGSLPDGLPAEMYGSLVTYANEAGVPVVLDAGGAELLHAAAHRPALVVTDTRRVRDDADLAGTLHKAGASAVVVAGERQIAVMTAEGRWTARVAEPAVDVTALSARGALIAGMVPGQLLGWSWPDRLRHALGLAGAHSRTPEEEGDVDLAAYERLVEAVVVSSAPEGYFIESPISN